MTDAKRYFFCGIAGSGMLPLAMIVRAQGHEVWGSDRNLDQGRVGDKFAWLEQQGVRLFAQDGSGIESGEQIVVASAAVEATVPDIVRATGLGCQRMTRAELNAGLFNAAGQSVGVGGTSGKSTVTGMIGWILHQAGRDPTVMNGAVMRNFAGPDNPFASALVGGADWYVSEVDESDGSIALYQPDVAVVTNISLDHKSLDELQALFGDFAAKAGTAVVNADDEESAPLWDGNVTFGFADEADVQAVDFEALTDGSRFAVLVDGTQHVASLKMPGRHNAANALAAIAATRALGVPVAEAVAALAEFAGLARRYEVIGTAGGVTVIDDFAHNPDKVAATLAAATALPGRLLIFFQPHGYGPLKQMGKELAASFAAGMRDGDKLFVCDPVYFGGTVDRSTGSKALVFDVISGSGYAVHMSRRESCGEAIVNEARPGDRVLVLGARDDTLTDFAQALLRGLTNEAGQ
ncbi:UDP-N-acetylmuramate--alanine ligase [Sphingomonas lacunae]|uniref:UDP-N-acetylmuramate--alanine ligase n=1 Tax=Sphingomonas lacunae TaxID=2698828 RepID=A0A6M4AVQ5_9SPHN|nr:Mur ligase family protein [Sphingomonas lacunae]QJQ33227.1 UDP-N-acetylmuramate--alanine ligase [Sphingomonas lacunae]